MPGPEVLQVSHLDPGHGLHVTCMHSVTRFEVRDLSVFWPGTRNCNCNCNCNLDTPTRGAKEDIQYIHKIILEERGRK